MIGILVIDDMGWGINETLGNIKALSVQYEPVCLKSAKKSDHHLGS